MKTVTITLTDTEYENVTALAKAEGATAADFFRNVARKLPAESGNGHAPVLETDASGEEEKWASFDAFMERWSGFVKGGERNISERVDEILAEEYAAAHADKG